MASLSSSYAALGEYEVQRAMKREVSALLRRARNPRALAAMPMMRALCSETGIADPVAALESVVRMVFDGNDRSTVALRDAILQADFADGATNSEVASAHGISRRHFQRRRADAVTAIAHYARGLMPRSDSVSSPRSTEPHMRFERERIAFADARDRDAVLEMRAIAGNLLRLAENTAQRATACACRAEANVRLGRREEAKQDVALLDPAQRELLAARLALLDGDRNAACVRAKAALALFEGDGENAKRCRYLLGLISASEPLTAFGTPVAGPSRDCWWRNAERIQRARRRMRAGYTGEAERCALPAFRSARSRGFAELEAGAATVMQSLAGLRGDLVAAQKWRACAVASLLSSQDRLLAATLRADDQLFGDWEVDRSMTAVLYARLQLVVPQMQADSEAQADAISDLLARLAEMLLGGGSTRRDRMAHVLRRVRACDSAFIHYGLSPVEPVCEMMTLALSGIAGKRWDSLYEPVEEALHEIAAQLRPAQRRTIAVAVPQSQRTALVHFRNHDERRGCTAEPVEALADLRLRLVSV